jgi:hypothetical protein
MKRRKRFVSTSEDIDPMIYSVNMVDCMLVLAVGFLIFSIMSMNLQSVIFSDLSPDERMEVSELIKQTILIKMGKEINTTTLTKSGSGNGFEQMGTVYKDPSTGKLILIPNG